MILSDEERIAALESILEMVKQPGFQIANVTLDAPATPGGKMHRRPDGVWYLPGHNLPANAEIFHDTGVRIITIIGHVPKDPPSFGPLVSETAEETGGLVMDDE